MANMKRAFFDRDVVMRAENAATLSAMRKIGAMIRTVARRSMRKARQMKLDEMKPEDAAKWRMQQRIAKYYGRKAPPRPLKGSDPGSPPRYRWSRLLKDRLFFAYDSSTRTVVIGPERLGRNGGKVPRLLEEGGVGDNGKHIAARPYMKPALDQVRPKMAAEWAKAFRAKSRG
ncbi:MAG: hypothetical protein IT450_17945 [Phycisphaerales bacterium]|nr:hypothetical protein [Phycisphaerales bacterium]